ncbi:uncharacterized protein LOC131928473 [Physella acuta]|uniref:uncharacterized protein LOC131928473 n=1 Tax=Physella acuta TaxID=109671 RepID=UPI0027DD7C14|nr:uncharacterized protein LOC131928473 [Physella acuta]
MLSLIRILYAIICIFSCMIGLTFLIVFDMSFSVLGVVLRNNFNFKYRNPSVLVPIWFNIADDLYFNEWSKEMSRSTFVMFIIPVVEGIFGFLLIFFLKFWISAVMSVMGILGIIAQSYFFAQLRDPNGRVHSAARDALKLVIRRSYQLLPGNSATAAFNALMIMGKCCGIEGPKDFVKDQLQFSLIQGQNPLLHFTRPSWIPSTYKVVVPKVTFSSSFKVPPACCDTVVFKSDNETQRFYEVVGCASTDDSPYINQEGCYMHYFLWFFRSEFNVAYVLCLTIGLAWTCLGILIGVQVMRSHLS